MRSHDCLHTLDFPSLDNPELPCVIAGVAGGSTRAALTLHFAKKNNAADISAKEGTQVHILCAFLSWLTAVVSVPRDVCVSHIIK